MSLDPSDYTVKELRDELEKVEEVSELESVLESEKEGKDRKTAKQAIEKRIDEISSEEDDKTDDQDGGGDEGSEGESEDEGDGEGEKSESGEDDSSGEDEEEDNLDHPTADKKYVKALEDGVYRDMWVYCESHDGELLTVSKEMLGKARNLMDKYNDDYDADERVVAVLVGDDVADLTDEVISYGADVVVYQEDSSLERFRHKPYSEIVVDMARSDAEWRDYDEPRYIVFPATNNGRDLSAQVLAELDSGLASDCSDLYIEENEVSHPAKTGERGAKKTFERVLHMKRPDFSGFEYSTILCLDSPDREFHPQGASVIPGSFDVPDPDPERVGEVIEYDVDLKDEWFRVEVKDYDKLDSGVDLTGYEVIVALGRGIGDDPTRGIELGLELVDQFDDAELGLSRGVVTASYQVEGHVEQYITEERQIGETGQEVEPDLYIAAGISGAVQHKVGMDESDTIIAINTDDDARIKDFSDYYIVGDLFEVLPQLIEGLETGELPIKAAADGSGVVQGGDSE